MKQKEVSRLANALARAVEFSYVPRRNRPRTLWVEFSDTVRLIGHDGKGVASGPDEVARAILAIRKEAGDA